MPLNHFNDVGVLADCVYDLSWNACQRVPQRKVDSLTGSARDGNPILAGRDPFEDIAHGV